MKVLTLALALVLLVSSVMASGYHHYEEPKIIKIIKPVHIIKVVKHIPPPIPVIKYVKLYHSTTVGHHGGYGGGFGGGYGGGFGGGHHGGHHIPIYHFYGGHGHHGR